MLRLLEDAWGDLDGSEDKSTFAKKLHRAEDLEWDPPFLHFTLERHGATVNGSSRAELHHWEVNVDTGVAAIWNTSRRQVSPMDSRLDVAALARETKKRVVAGDQHDSLKWIDETHVVILVGKIIPEPFHRLRLAGESDSMQHWMGK